MRNVKITFTKEEIKDLLISWIAISLAFGIVMNGFNLQLPLAMLFSAITVGVGFIFHELAHKFVAFRRGCSAHFKANKSMLVLAIIISFLGFVFVAPGAVMVYGVNNKKDNGLISAAGPAANIILGTLFLLGLVFLPFGKTLFQYGLLINAWLALFNMIPVMPFDGVKIWRWDRIAYVTLISLSIILIFIQSFV